MKLTLICVFVAFSLEACLGLTFHTIPKVEVEEQQSCCSLKWVHVRSEDVLNSAIGVTVDGRRVFFAKNVPGPSLDFLNEQAIADAGDKYILANPHNCSLVWISHTASSYQDKQPHLYLPIVHSLAISSGIEEGYGEEEDNGEDAERTPSRYEVAELVDIFYMNLKYIRTPSNCKSGCRIDERKLLFVDCTKSMQNVLATELESIELNEASLLINSVHTEIESVLVTNEKEHDVTHWFGVYKPVLALFRLQLDNYSAPFAGYLKNSPNLIPFKERNAGSVLKNIYQSPGADTLLSSIYSEGKTSSGPIFQMISLEQQVNVPARSTCKVSVLITSFYSADERINVTFGLVPHEGVRDHWTNSRIVSSLETSGFDTKQLLEENGKLIVRYPGRLEVSSFVSEGVGVKCQEATLANCV